MVPPATGSHHLAASRLVRVFSRYADAHPDRCVLFVPRAPIWTATDTYLEPDLFLVASERLVTMDAGHMTVADLVVEILLPGSAVYDRTAKADTYAALGVPELWLVDLEQRSIELRVLADGAWRVLGTYTGPDGIESVAFPGLRAVPADVFA